MLCCAVYAGTARLLVEPCLFVCLFVLTKNLPDPFVHVHSHNTLPPFSVQSICDSRAITSLATSPTVRVLVDQPRHSKSYRLIVPRSDVDAAPTAVKMTLVESSAESNVMWCQPHRKHRTANDWLNRRMLKETEKESISV